MSSPSARREQTIRTAIASYGQRLAGFIRRRVPSDADAEDVLQDVWLQLSSVVELDPIERLSAWLFRVARNRITDRYRKKQALPFSQLESDRDDADRAATGRTSPTRRIWKMRSRGGCSGRS